ncbi:Rqc2 family fibronectin-binding protein [Alkalicoccobacillus porphyridii]|uniref:Rqc2 homolog RqcH n=1 Tax=Alkalicoccobacillus porphyridii TaxID=2597270 RepID=A0A553ZY63_9BACI|nr:NFACT RNA binding domain-containing protein [Alkalicoccobacillus porphyridii]TSB46355.1 fibronectin/fibrinogen-binding protein [Alkalicoccobacillus porphyridii]
MSFDGVMTRAVVHEISDQLANGRISKIYQPYKTELVFTIRANGQNHSLLLSANASFARAHITAEKYDNPSVPPMFCMLLRKHLEGGIIRSIKQEQMDRIIHMVISNRDELGDEKERRLIIEIMGRHSNIILVDPESEVIIDSIKHVRLDQSSYRTVGPGQAYKRPPEQHKLDVTKADADDVLKHIDFNSGKLSQQLVDQFAGLSPLLAEEIVSQSGLANRQTLPDAFSRVLAPVVKHEYQPEMVMTERKEYFSVLPLTHIEGKRLQFATVSQLLDRFFYGKAERDRVRQQAFDLERFLRNEWQKNKRKLKKLRQTLKSADQAALYQKYGELVTANLYQIKKGDASVEVIDYYDEEAGMIQIELDPLKSPSDNAQAYFKRYNKAKNSVKAVEHQLELTEKEMDYLDGLLQQMESASPRDLEEIREELMGEGYIKRRQSKKPHKKKKETKPQLEKYLSSAGIEFLVGKNNTQNEYLTNRLARQDEIWLHTKDIPGSHVVVRSLEPDEETIKEAAVVAAFYSKARLSSSVPVDYTRIRFVKKPNGSKPGYVTYDKQTTVFVTPDEDQVMRLRAR